MSALDISITVILVYFFLRGIFRGLVKEVVGILGLFVAFWAASVYWQAGADQLKPVINSDTYRAVLSFVVIYLIVYFLVGLMSVFVDKIVKLTITPFISGLAGAGLGLLKGSVLCLVILAGSTAFLTPDNTFYADSWTWPKVLPFCDTLKDWMPEKMKSLFGGSPTQARGQLTPPQMGRTAPLPSASNQNQTRKPTIPTNYQELVTLARAYPSLITQPWLEKIYSLPPAEVTTELLQSFVQENPSLFTGVAPAAGSSTGTTGAAPSWPSPASE
ncbi:MAG: CvpA family protein [Deltaproteobacteria bacterium]|jgi:membrane protein required for colicin V production|nr:CvpA family protein [Deltaproteobacteria bacterium]